ncbi:MAG TPA: citrate/2-methylcitrate synthase [Ktedonobacteraceae bacterium]|nr:citrate/2-methylcitrate synthase [Ktedonobacteraceae bacterium]
MSTLMPETGNNPQKDTTTAVATKPGRGGLEGMAVGTTTLSKVEEKAGQLLYRGHNIHDLVGTTTFEEVAHLLWFGHLPSQMELSHLKTQLVAERAMPAPVVQLLRDLPSTIEPMDALRTAVSLWGAITIKGKPTLEQVIGVTARFPLFLAAFHRLRHGLEPLESRSELGHAANYLYLLTGQVPNDEQVKQLDAYMVLLAEHGITASTFTARVVASTESDLVSAVVAALGALKGPLDGGAPSKVQDMLEAIGTAEHPEDWLRSALAKGERVMGFGHRIYETEDPRTEALREMARIANPQEVALANGVEEVALPLLEQQRPGRHLHTNVAFYSAILLTAVGLPADLFTPTFAVGRVVGWTAHILEQVGNNRVLQITWVTQFDPTHRHARAGWHESIEPSQS